VDKFWAFAREFAEGASFRPFGRSTQRVGPTYDGEMTDFQRPVHALTREVIDIQAQGVQRSALGLLPLSQTTFPVARFALPANPFHVGSRRVSYEPCVSPSQATLPLDATLTWIEQVGAAQLGCANLLAQAMDLLQWVHRDLPQELQERAGMITGAAMEAVQGSLQLGSLSLFNATMLRREASVAASEFAADTDFKQIAMKSSLVPEALFGPEAADAVPATRQRLHNAVMEKAATTSVSRSSTGGAGHSFRSRGKKRSNSNPNKATKARRARRKKFIEAGVGKSKSEGRRSDTTGQAAGGGTTTAPAKSK
jgi:hypothetical protein